MVIKESSLKNLKPNKSHWNNSETTTIRVPKVLKDKVLEIAKNLDKHDNIVIDYNSTVTYKIDNIITKVKKKEKGYKNNSASQLIKDLLEIVEYQ